MKYVVVTGGVVSGLGKGITSSSLGVLLQACGLRVTAIKIDPYLNTDAGTMSPYEHGEVYVLEDGGEVDLDLGNYERFLGNVCLTRDHNITTGKIFAELIQAERRGDYLGKTVQLVPHARDLIVRWIERVAALSVSASGRPDVCLIELGGTVGDIESMLFLEALRHLQSRANADEKGMGMCHVHVSLVPSVGEGEPKSKPTQHGIRELRAAGMTPNLVVCRSSQELPHNFIRKVAESLALAVENVVSVHNVSNIYRVPLLLLRQNVHTLVLGHLGLASCSRTLHIPGWYALADACDATLATACDATLATACDATLATACDATLGTEMGRTVAIVGKYTGLSDSYLSITHALRHAAMELGAPLKVIWIDAEHLETPPSKSDSTNQTNQRNHDATDTDRWTRFADAWARLGAADCVLVPGGFGERGMEGMIAAIHHARLARKPFLGICLGMQMAIVEWCRSVLCIPQARSAEQAVVSKQTDDSSIVIVEMPEIERGKMGGTMRLGVRSTSIRPGTLAAAAYTDGKEKVLQVLERHRHRYEVRPSLVDRIEASGMHFSGQAEHVNSSNATDRRMEICELPTDEHPFFVGVQFHPEFLSRPLRPSPLFRMFLRTRSVSEKQT